MQQRRGLPSAQLLTGELPERVLPGHGVHRSERARLRAPRQRVHRLHVDSGLRHWVVRQSDLRHLELCWVL